MNVPELRFRQFMPGGGYDSSRQDLNNWNKYKLEQISTIFDGTHSTPNYKKSGVPFYSVENIKDLKTNKYISIDEFHKNFKNNKPKYNDIFMTRIGDIGSTNIIETDDDIAYYVSLALIRSNENIIDPFYLMYQITDPVIQDELWKRTLHVAFPKKINKDEIGKIPVSVTSITEQKRIGIFFQKLDHLIQLQQQKVERLNQLKRGYLQKIFPVNKDLVPRIRFGGFNKAWIGVSLFELIEYENSHHTYSEIKRYKHGNYPVFDAIGEISRISQFDQNKKYISIIKDGSGVGKTTLRQSKSSIIGTMGYLKPKNLYIYFMNYLIETIDFKKYIVGSSIPHIYFKDYSKMVVHIPEMDEQKKIGLFFKNLDDDLDKNNNKLIVLNLLKKGYLQKLFC